MKLFLHISIFLILVSGNAMAEQQKTELATFAGGCFWCMEPPFDNTKGVISTTSGYSGGSAETANYAAVSTGQTKHLEVIQIEYDPNIVSYDKLVDVYIKNIDPIDPAGQFADKGPQYLTAILYHNDEQKIKAQKALAELNKKEEFRGRIAIIIGEFKTFYPAEDYHQNYYKKNPLRYNAYKYGSGRVQKLEELWDE